MTDLVKYSRDGRLVRITLNRPDKLNALSDDVLIELRQAFYDFDDDQEAWVAILSGEGRAFCSGADVGQRQLRPIDELKRLGGPQGRGAEVGHLMSRFVNTKPVIAAVHGYAVGAGFLLALQCDLCVASEDATFQIREAERGLDPSEEWLYMRERGAGTLATELALTNRFCSAEEAYRFGLVNRVVPTGEHLRGAEKLAEEVLNVAPLAARALVRTRRWPIEELDVRARQYETAHLELTEDFRESASAFVDRRPRKPFTAR